MLAEGDVAEDLGGEVDVAGGGDLGLAALVGTDHGWDLGIMAFSKIV